MLQRQKNSEHVGVESGAEVLDGLAGDRAALAFGTSVIDGHIEAPETSDGAVHQLLDIVFLANVGAMIFGLGPRCAKFRHKGLAGLVTTAAYDNLRALPSEGEGGRAADAGQGARDQNNWF